MTETTPAPKKTVTLGRALDKITMLLKKEGELAHTKQEAAIKAKIEAVNSKIAQLTNERTAMAVAAGQEAYNLSKCRTRAECKATWDLLSDDDRASLKKNFAMDLSEIDKEPEEPPTTQSRTEPPPAVVTG